MRHPRLRAAPIRRPWPWLSWVAAFCLLWCGAASALSPDKRISDFKITTWGSKEGAPTAVVALAQTSDGYLWTGSAAGLVRFDGLRFEPINLPRDKRLPSASVYTLFAPASGGLWVGFTFGSLAFLHEGRLTVYTEKDGLPAGTVQAIAMDSDGSLWAGTTSGLARLEGSRWRRFGADQGYAATMTLALFVDSAGSLWALSESKAFSMARGEARFRESAVPIGDHFERGILESPTGEVAATGGHDDVVVMLAKNENPTRATTPVGSSFMFDRDGSLWGFGRVLTRIGQPSGLNDFLWANIRKREPSYSEHRVGHYAAVLLEDKEGNVWFPSAAGLNRISERNVDRVELPSNASTPYSLGVAAGDGGSVWLADRTTGRSGHLLHGRFTASGVQDTITCVTRTADGAIWFGGLKSLWKLASGRLERVTRPADTEGRDIQAMAVDRAGDLWVSIVRNGVFRLSRGQWSLNGGVEALPKLPALTLAADRGGRVWFGYTEGRVAVLEGDMATVYADSNGLHIGNVTALHAKRSRVWVGGDFGLAVFDGKGFRAVTTESASAFDSVTGLVETQDGDLWINSRGGIVHLTAAEAVRAATDASYRPRGEVFNSLDGVEGSSARLRPLPSAVEGTDGKLWFLTDQGLYSIDPGRIHRNPVPPPVVIERLAVGDRTFVPAGDVRLAPGTTAVRIDYVGLSLTLPEKVRYRYKLDGVDKDWHDAQGRRQASYTDLGPGRHRFRVTAANNDGVWNETGAAVEFLIPPTFMQTGWFIALCVTGVALLVWVSVMVRVRQVSTRMRERFAVRLAERERIARELHDTLLQSTQGLILRFQAVVNRFEPGDPTHTLLNETLDRADVELAEARDRVQDLRESADPSRGLADAWMDIGKELAQGQPTKFSVVLEGRQRTLQPVVKDEVYRIGREALLNAFRHAKATTIEVQVIYGETEFRLRIRDDGVGVDEAVAKTGTAGHWGLQGMRERANRIGGHLDIWSRPGAGTELELMIASGAVYAKR